MKKIVSTFIGSCFALLILGLCSCEKEELFGMDHPVTHENIAVSVTGMFGDEESTYLVADVVLSDVDSVSDGKIADIIVSGDGNGGYSWHCIGYNEEENTQIYLISVNSPEKLVRKIEFLDFRSAANPMNTIVDASWEFSVDTAMAEPLMKTLVIQDELLSEIKVYKNALILVPADGMKAEDLYVYEIFVRDGTGTEMELVANSIKTERCYFRYGCLLLGENVIADEVKTVVIGEKEYVFS